MLLQLRNYVLGRNYKTLYDKYLWVQLFCFTAYHLCRDWWVLFQHRTKAPTTTRSSMTSWRKHMKN